MKRRRHVEVVFDLARGLSAAFFELLARATGTRRVDLGFLAHGLFRCRSTNSLSWLVRLPMQPHFPLFPRHCSSPMSGAVAREYGSASEKLRESLCGQDFDSVRRL